MADLSLVREQLARADDAMRIAKRELAIESESSGPLGEAYEHLGEMLTLLSAIDYDVEYEQNQSKKETSRWMT